MTLVLAPLALFFWKKWLLNSTHTHALEIESLQWKGVSNIHVENVKLLILLCLLTNSSSPLLSHFFFLQSWWREVAGTTKRADEAHESWVLTHCIGHTAALPATAARCSPGIPERTSSYSSGLTVGKRLFLLALSLLRPTQTVALVRLSVRFPGFNGFPCPDISENPADILSTETAPWKDK